MDTGSCLMVGAGCQVIVDCLSVLESVILEFYGGVITFPCLKCFRLKEKRVESSSSHLGGTITIGVFGTKYFPEEVLNGTGLIVAGNSMGFDCRR